MSTTFDLISSTIDPEGPFCLSLTLEELNSVLYILKPQPEQSDYIVENAKFQELKAVISAYESNGGFYEGASSCINRYQYCKILEVLDEADAQTERVIAVRKQPQDYEPILKYYNDRRPEGSRELEELDRMERGFKIRLPETSEYGLDPDCKIAQMRWARGHLVPGYIGFTSGEKNLLFEALCNTLGEHNVYYVSKEDANSNPTRYHVSVTPNGHELKCVN